MTKRKTILLADDNLAIRECFSEIIKGYFPDYNLETFEDGGSLDERLKKNTEDVALVSTDNEMPGINGSEIIPEYAEKVPMMLMYGGAPHLGEKAVENGAFGYLLKPASLVDFTQMLKMVLDNPGNFKK